MDSFISMHFYFFLRRESVSSDMRQQDPEGFAQREPGNKRIIRQPLVKLGPHHEWSGDGHDKLAKIGFPIWGVRDVWSGKWLGLWVIPNNRLKKAIGYLYLSLVAELGGSLYFFSYQAIHIDMVYI